MAYVIKPGDTLWSLAEDNNTTVEELMRLNPYIKQEDLIVVGQTINLTEPATTTKTTTSKVSIKIFGLQTNTTRNMYVVWEWSGKKTESYQVIWYYDTGDGVWFVGNNTTNAVDKESPDASKQSLWTAPENAKKVKVKIKPIPEKKNGSSTASAADWTATWESSKTYTFSAYPMVVPSAPTVTIDKYKLTVKVAGLSVAGDGEDQIQFKIVKDDKTVFKTGTADVVVPVSGAEGTASYSCTVTAGSEYKVCCRAVRYSDYSDWSPYSSPVSTIPDAPTSIKTCKATSETSVYLEWSSSKTATTYDIEYTTKKEYFNGSDQLSTVTGIETTKYEKTGLATGEEYFFRVRAVNSLGSSGWSEIKSVVLGDEPIAPTTWSSTTTAITGEPVVLYWVHNSEDGSSQTFAELEIDIGGNVEVLVIENSKDEDEKDKTSSYSIDTNNYTEGTQILWRVRTAGITNVLGEWSIQRTIDVHAPPTLELNVTDINGNELETLTTFPFYIYGLAGPNTQVPTGYHLTISSNEVYETVDNMGNPVTINKGEAVYSKYFDTSTPLLVELSAHNINLENTFSYTVTCVVSMNSGLTAEASTEFEVSWTDEAFEPNAEIDVDLKSLVVRMRPYCVDGDGVMLDNVLLSVYRREFDGSFTEIAVDLNNKDYTFVTDPHPALDAARYRIVAKTVGSGAVSYFDVPGIAIGEKAVVIQWDEKWTNFDHAIDEEPEEPTWAGSLLKLPYNIDVQDNYSADVALVEYIGRKNPVAYYGTQIGSSATWNVEIEKTDTETLYALRRLAVWMGDVYVREPSGSGYWANVSVSFSQKYNELTIPVTLNITRVEGGA